MSHWFMQRAAAAAIALVASVSASAQTHPMGSGQAYPMKPVRLVLGFSPGGSTDVVARLVAKKLNEKLGQPFIVENRPGAGGNIGTQLVARSAADGYTLFYATSSAAVNMTLYANPGFNLADDFAAVAPVCAIPGVLLVHPSIPAKSVKELVALARTRPGEITYASAGMGSTTHLATELFKSIAGVNLLHVPYQGAGPAMNDLLGGHVQMQFVYNAALVAANAKAGRVRALAVTSPQRFPSMPELPTMQEAGIKGYEAVVWNGILAPAATPRDIVSRLNAQTAQTMKELTPALREIGASAMYATPEQYAAFVKTEIGKWAGIIKRTGAKGE